MNVTKKVQMLEGSERSFLEQIRGKEPLSLHPSLRNKELLSRKLKEWRKNPPDDLEAEKECLTEAFQKGFSSSRETFSFQIRSTRGSNERKKKKEKAIRKLRPIDRKKAKYKMTWSLF